MCEIELEKWSLVYRGSRDGFSGNDFHLKTDSIENTLTLIKVTNGNIFGGFTEKEWHSFGGFHLDPKAYVFSIVNKDLKPFKTPCSFEGQIGCFSNSGPIFGKDEFLDFCIKGNSNINKDSLSNFGSSYKHPDYKYGTEKAKSILAGSHYFQTVEMEVYARELPSPILTTKETDDLKKLLGIDLNNKWALLYRASRDGFRGEDFRSNCVGISRTLTVIKATSGNVFGGYTEKAWHADDSWITDPIYL